MNAGKERPIILRQVLLDKDIKMCVGSPTENQNHFPVLVQ